MKTVYFHIGTSKTGTSAIQAFLSDNRDILKEKGYCYELMPFPNLGRANNRRNAHFLIENVLDESGKIDAEATEIRIKEGYQTIEGWLQKYDAIVLTDESFWNGMVGEKWKSIERLKQFLDSHNATLKIVVYLRSQEEYMASWWKQNVRSGKMTQSWQKFYKKAKGMRLNYSKQIKKYSSYVGTQNMIVRRYEVENFKGNAGTIFSDFLDAIGLEYTDEYIVRDSRVNISLTDNCAEIKRVLNQLSKEEEFEEINSNLMFEKAALFCSKISKDDTKYSLYSKEEQQWIWDKSDKSNREVKELFFPEECELFCRKFTNLEKWNPSNEKMLEDVIMYFGALALQQEQKNLELQIEIKNLKEEMLSQKKQIRKIESLYYSNQGELKALRVFLKPVKWIWRKIHR